MTTMVEIASRAACASKGYDPDFIIPAGQGVDSTFILDGKPHSQWEFFLASTRAAMCAMREPSGDMVFDAQREHVSLPDRMSPAEVFEHVWRAMIDAALLEKPE